MVLQHSVEANLDKVRAIMEMAPPNNIKVVQSLNDRIAAFNRFVSRATDKCLPFSKILQKAFKWIDECQKAFEELKAYLASLLLLNPFKLGEELSLYLAMSQMAGFEGRYPPMEKLAFTLITAVRKLRLYF
ncbi:uncharacterized protein LOC142644134 [Castanea sativa]|uniref:uncharacterized protein LOC142644134 n=1 Tax=Castanea sativa TaxID=21020 RepID=UPI003F64A3D5